MISYLKNTVHQDQYIFLYILSSRIMERKFNEEKYL